MKWCDGVVVGLRQGIMTNACLQIIHDGHGEHWMGVGRAPEEIYPLMGTGGRAGVPFGSGSSSDEIGARQTTGSRHESLLMKREHAVVIIEPR
jgi:hypothetical protein